MATTVPRNCSSSRVLLVSPLPPPSGGIGRWAVLLLGWMAAEPNVSVRVVDTSPRWRAVEDLKLWKRAVGGVLQGLRDAWRILVQLVVFRPHVLHLSTSAQLRGPWDTVMLAVAAIVRVRSVYHIHMGRLPEVMAQQGGEWWGLRWALKLASQVVVLDKASEEAVRRFLPAGRVVRLPNAIALQPADNERGIPELPSVLYLGHVIPTKGMRELMEAWGQLRPQGWRLRLAGQGSAAYQKELLGIVGMEAGVEFLGDLPHEAALRRMQAADIFVLPTYTEGFPNVILEAMAAGKAIISTSVGAIPEMLDVEGDEPCGLVVKSRDAGALGAALRRLMSDSQLRGILERRARAKVARCYTTEVVFARLLDLWNDTAGRHAVVGAKSNCLAGR
jgi:glycosyltransferase involved in cell wall biosynthesis